MIRQPAPEVVAAPSFLRSIRLVAWSFLGVRSNSEYQQDLAKVSPLHVVIVGLVGVLLLVGGLMALASWVVAK